VPLSAAAGPKPVMDELRTSAEMELWPWHVLVSAATPRRTRLTIRGCLGAGGCPEAGGSWTKLTIRGVLAAVRDLLRDPATAAGADTRATLERPPAHPPSTGRFGPCPLD